MNAWIGVDPGARYTGVVVWAGVGAAVLHVAIIDRDFGDPAAYLNRVEDEIANALIQAGHFDGHPYWRVAIEDVNAPSPHMGIARPADLIAVGRAVGYLQRGFPGALLVPPNKHGSRPWGTYPPELLTAREKANAKAKPLAIAGQSSLMRHARSAYDVALAAPLTARMEAARRPA